MGPILSSTTRDLSAALVVSVLSNPSITCTHSHKILPFIFFFPTFFLPFSFYFFFLNKSLRFSFSQIYVFLLAFAELLSEVFCAASWHSHTHTHTESSQKDVKKKMEIKQEGKNEVRKSRAPVAAGKWKMGWGWAK